MAAELVVADLSIPVSAWMVSCSSSHFCKTLPKYGPQYPSHLFVLLHDTGKKIACANVTMQALIAYQSPSQRMNKTSWSSYKSSAIVHSLEYTPGRSWRRAHLRNSVIVPSALAPSARTRSPI